MTASVYDTINTAERYEEGKVHLSSKDQANSVLSPNNDTVKDQANSVLSPNDDTAFH